MRDENLSARASGHFRSLLRHELWCMVVTGLFLDRLVAGETVADIAVSR